MSRCWIQFSLRRPQHACAQTIDVPQWGIEGKANVIDMHALKMFKQHIFVFLLIHVVAQKELLNTLHGVLFESILVANRILLIGRKRVFPAKHERTLLLRSVRELGIYNNNDA